MLYEVITRIATLKDRIRRAEQAVEREKAQASQQKLFKQILTSKVYEAAIETPLEESAILVITSYSIHYTKLYDC